MSDHIPQEVLIDILKRLTIEELVRFTVVCKSWYSLITSPLFISVQMSSATTTTRNAHLLLVRDCTEKSKRFDFPIKTHKEKYSIHLHNDDDDTFPVYKSFDFPFKTQNSYSRVIGCCNGVICLSDDSINTRDLIILWNPSIRKSVTLPPDPFLPNLDFDAHSIGFGFNAATNNYKVVRVVYLKDKFWLDDPQPMVQVYELGVGSWTSVDPKGFSYIIRNHTSQVFLNGAVHWIGGNCNKKGAEYLNLIVSFDLRNDAFDVINYPDSVADKGFGGGCVSVLGESLALIQISLPNHLLSRYFPSCNVWVMRQYWVASSWTKLFSIDLTGGVRRVCGVLKNEEALLIVANPNSSSSCRGQALVSYDPESKQKNHIGEVQVVSSVYVDYFVETLALLGVKGESAFCGAAGRVRRQYCCSRAIP